MPQELGQWYKVGEIAREFESTTFRTSFRDFVEDPGVTSVATLPVLYLFLSFAPLFSFRSLAENSLGIQVGCGELFA